MKDKTFPAQPTPEPWTHSAQAKELQGARRESHVTQRIKRDKAARRRDEKSPERGQEDPPTGTVGADDIYARTRLRR
jgi:hypothetical protein